MGRNAKKVEVEGEEHVEGSEEQLAEESNSEEQPTETMAEIPQEDQAPPADPVAPRQFRIVAGPHTISHAGMPAPLSIGKVVSDHVADIDALRKQGVVFEEVK